MPKKDKDRNDPQPDQTVSTPQEPQAEPELQQEPAQEPEAAPEQSERKKPGLFSGDAKALRECRAALEKAEAQRDQYLAMAQRVQADFDNYRRRNETSGAQRYAEGLADMIAAMLPVADNLERALASATDETSKALIDGVVMVQKQLLTALEAKGCKALETPKGTAFDPNCHNAVMTAPRGEQDAPATVCETFQKGYVLRDKVVRYAMVSVFES